MNTPPRGTSFIALLAAMALGPAVLVGKCVMRPKGDDFGTVDSRVSMSVAIVTVDRIAPRSLHPYDAALPAQPGLDEMARLGITVNLAMAPSDGEPRSAAAIMTGTLPSTLGVLDWSDRLSGSTFTLAKAFTARKFATAAFTNAPLLSLTGLSSGFTTTHEDLNAGSVELASSVSAWLATVGRTPFFLWIHCTPDPAIADGRDADASKVLEHLVAELEAALTKARWYEGTLIIAAGTYDEVGGDLQVPLLFKIPKRNPTNVTRTGPCSLLDLAPTILDLFAMKGDLPFSGRSLMTGPGGNAPLLNGYYFNDRAVLERYSPGSREPTFCLRVPQYELLYGGQPNSIYLFERPSKGKDPNLATSPKFKNVIEGNNGLLQDLFERRRKGPKPQKAEKAPPMSEKTKAILDRRAK